MHHQENSDTSTFNGALKTKLSGRRSYVYFKILQQKPVLLQWQTSKKKQNPVLLERWTSQKILKITKSGLALQVFKHGLFSQAQHTLRRDLLDFFQHF